MVKEPRKQGSLILKVPVVRRGDVSKESIVRVYSRDGSAKSGTDYIGFSDGELKLHPAMVDVVLESCFNTTDVKTTGSTLCFTLTL
jgi:hypothetical protein